MNDNEWLNQVFFQDSSFEGTAGRPDEHRGRHGVVVAWTRGHRQFHVETWVKTRVDPTWADSQRETENVAVFWNILGKKKGSGGMIRVTD